MNPIVVSIDPNGLLVIAYVLGLFLAIGLAIGMVMAEGQPDGFWMTLYVIGMIVFWPVTVCCLLFVLALCYFFRP